MDTTGSLLDATVRTMSIQSGANAASRPRPPLARGADGTGDWSTLSPRQRARATRAGFAHPRDAQAALPISSIGQQVTSGRSSSPAVSFTRSPRFGSMQSTYISRAHNANMPSTETQEAEYSADLAGRVGNEAALSGFRRPRAAATLRSRSPKMGRLKSEAASDAAGIGPGSHHPRDPLRPVFGDAGAPMARRALGSRGGTAAADPKAQWQRAREAAERARQEHEHWEEERRSRRERVEAAILQRKLKRGTLWQARPAKGGEGRAWAMAAAVREEEEEQARGGRSRAGASPRRPATSVGEHRGAWRDEWKSPDGENENLRGNEKGRSSRRRRGPKVPGLPLPPVVDEDEVEAELRDRATKLRADARRRAAGSADDDPPGSMRAQLRSARGTRAEGTSGRAGNLGSVSGGMRGRSRAGGRASGRRVGFAATSVKYAREGTFALLRREEPAPDKYSLEATRQAMFFPSQRKRQHYVGRTFARATREQQAHMVHPVQMAVGVDVDKPGLGAASPGPGKLPPPSERHARHRAVPSLSFGGKDLDAPLASRDLPGPGHYQLEENDGMLARGQMLSHRPRSPRAAFSKAQRQTDPTSAESQRGRHSPGPGAYFRGVAGSGAADSRIAGRGGGSGVVDGAAGLSTSRRDRAVKIPRADRFESRVFQPHLRHMRG